MNEKVVLWCFVYGESEWKKLYDQSALLADNYLTWSKGYPSVSECEGEEGELIPEMHDALLNDPDVLR